MKPLQLIFMALLLLLFSACNSFNDDTATRNTINVINMKVGASTTMRVFFEEPYDNSDGYYYDDDYYYNNLFFDDWSNTFVYDSYPNTFFPYTTTTYDDDSFDLFGAKEYDANGSAKRLYDSQTHYTSIAYDYNYSDSKRYYLNITDRSFLMFETYGSDDIKVPASNLRNREQSLVVFGSSSTDASLRIPLDIRVFTNVKVTQQDRVSINFINALPTKVGSNILPVLNYASTVHLEVDGVRVSAPLDYRENDRFEIDGVRDTQASIELTLVLANGAAPTWNKKLQNGHTYNVIVGHAENSLSAEPTLYVYDVTPAKDNT